LFLQRNAVQYKPTIEIVFLAAATTAQPELFFKFSRSRRLI